VNKNYAPTEFWHIWKVLLWVEYCCVSWNCHCMILDYFNRFQVMLYSIIFCPEGGRKLISQCYLAFISKRHQKRAWNWPAAQVIFSVSVCCVLYPIIFNGWSHQFKTHWILPLARDANMRGQRSGSVHILWLDHVQFQTFNFSLITGKWRGQHDESHSVDQEIVHLPWSKTVCNIVLKDTFKDIFP